MTIRSSISTQSLKLHVIYDMTASAEHHMKIDYDIIEYSNTAQHDEEPIKTAILRFYSWPDKGAFTVGRFVPVERVLHVDICQQKGITYAVRPTGGGVLFHGAFDCGFSLFLPKGHHLICKDPKQNYIQLHNIIHKACYDALCDSSHDEEKQKKTASSQLFLDDIAVRSDLCMASKTLYDILLFNYKVGGSACRITKKGLLFQASLFLTEPPWATLMPLLKNSAEALVAMKEKSSYLDCIFSKKSHTLRRIQVSLKTHFEKEC